MKPSKKELEEQLSGQGQYLEFLKHQLLTPEGSQTFIAVDDDYPTFDSVNNLSWKDVISCFGESSTQPYSDINKAIAEGNHSHITTSQDSYGKNMTGKLSGKQIYEKHERYRKNFQIGRKGAMKQIEQDFKNGDFESRKYEINDTEKSLINKNWVWASKIRDTLGEGLDTL